MFIYVVCYSLIGFLYFKLGDRKIDKVKLLIGILLLSLLAGFRDRAIGTDVMIYGERIYKAARSIEGWKELKLYVLRFRGGEGIEIGYLLYDYLVGIPFDDTGGYSEACSWYPSSSIRGLSLGFTG